jgi:hypothetical protein
VVNSHFEQVEPGVWLPQEIELQSIAPTEGGDYPEQYRGKLVLSTRIKVTKRLVNRVSEDVFAPFVKPGDFVWDMRKGPVSRPERR